MRRAALLLPLLIALALPGCTSAWLPIGMPTWGKTAKLSANPSKVSKTHLKPPRPPEYFRMGKIVLEPPLALSLGAPVRKVYVAEFENRSGYSAAHLIFRNALLYVLKERGLEVVGSPEEADLRMGGAVAVCNFKYTQTMFAPGFWSEFANGKTGRIHHARLTAELAVAQAENRWTTTATAVFRTKESDIASAANELSVRISRKVARAIR